MAIELKVPTLGESVTEATVARWLKQPGEAVKADEAIVELETDKVTLEVNAPAAGVVREIIAQSGATVGVGAVLGSFEAGAAGSVAAPAAPSAPKIAVAAVAAGSAAVASAAKPAGIVLPPPPAARKALAEAGLDANAVAGSGRDGQVLKQDVAAAVAKPAAAAMPAPAVAAPRPMPSGDDGTREERVRMSKLRQTIARRLKDAQNNAAILTTFNDVDMTAVMDLRTHYKELFEKRHGVKLGFMGFFVKACIQALREVPAVNAEIDGTDIVYKNYYHLGVAVGTDKGLVVPVLRNADMLSLSEIEASIGDFGKRARDGKLGIDEMQGGTFTISNGGVYGSLMSTPILNAPQSGILGMHRIEERPVVRNGQIVARPMMYLALSYDHRIIDGKEAVTFLVRVKECLEDPQRLMLEL